MNTQFPQLTMSWIHEVEMAESTDDLMTSQPIEGQRGFPDFEMLDARIASCVEKNHLKYLFQKESQCRRAAISKIQQILEREANCLHDLWPLSINQSL